ncbi:MAG: tRNA preQ1(34) S-adenosylmethionine ribosyltransferase-isomerase QueA [Clostridia bacterium]
MLSKKDFFFELPEKLIAQSPLDKRDTSRLLVLNKETGEITDKHFFDILDYLDKGDCLVLNDTKVIPARLYGTKKETGAKVEVVLLEAQSEKIWKALVRPGKKLRDNAEIYFSDKLSAKIITTIEGGTRLIEFYFEGNFYEILDEIGNMPLPPYITKKLDDNNKYQTVYAKYEGSAAAPTAGLHFTKELLDKVAQKGVKVTYITLHVGLGTFRPVKTDNILDHKMHSEKYFITEESAKIINDTKAAGGKIISVGTTSTRTLEANTEDGILKSGSGSTEIFIYPPYKFKMVDRLITNFHLPESTLIMLVSALSTREYILNAYNYAVQNEYRFFSFGDAMLIY